MLETGLRHLSDESVQRRFLTPKRSFSRAELRYLTEVNGRDHVALVVESPTDPARRLIAVGRFVRLTERSAPDRAEPGPSPTTDGATAEVAIVVADDWQRRGIGSQLAELLAAKARFFGIRRFTATMASDNVPAHRLMEKLTSHLDEHHTGAGVSELVLELAA